MGQTQVLSTVKKLVDRAIESKDFIPFNVSYPGFSVSKEKMTDALSQAIEQRVAINFSEGIYNSQKFVKGKSLSYEDLLQADEDRAKGKVKPENQGIYTVIDHLLFSDLEKDKTLLPKGSLGVISKIAFTKCLSDHVDASLMSIANADYGIVNDPKNKERMVCELAASMYYLKQANAPLYKELQRRVDQNINQDAAKLINAEVNSPSMNTVNALYNFDEGFTKEHFPKRWMEMKETNTIANRLMSKF